MGGCACGHDGGFAGAVCELSLFDASPCGDGARSLCREPARLGVFALEKGAPLVLDRASPRARGRSRRPGELWWEEVSVDLRGPFAASSGSCDESRNGQAANVLTIP